MHTIDSVLALSLLSPGFLMAGAALTAIPIIIHLLNRRRFKIVHWAAMEYLLQAMKKNRRRLKFEQWLLLLLRCTLLALLGLALARPMGCDNNSLAALAGKRNGLHVFVIDNSHSMAFEAQRPNAPTHFDQAKRMANTMMDRLVKGGESVVIISCGKPATAVIAKPSYSLDACHNAVDAMQQMYGGTDLAGALNKAVDISQDETKTPSKYLYIISDATRSSLENAQSDAIKKAAVRCQNEFGNADHIHYFNLGRMDQWNQTVQSLKPVGNLITTKYSADFAAEIGNFGTGTAPAIQWQIDERDVSGGGSVQLKGLVTPLLLANKPIRNGGSHVISARLANDDRLKSDNTRNLVVNVSSEIKVLVVDGERSSQGLAASGAFLETALSPAKSGSESTGVKSDSPIVPHVIGDQDLNEREVLSQYRAIMITNVAQISDAVAMQLEAYVKQGGVIVWFMGPKVDGDAYNRVLLAGNRKLLPGKLIEKISSTNVGKDSFLFDFKPDGDLSTYLNVFKGEANTGLGTSRIFQYWRLNIADPTTERILNYQAAGQATASPTATNGKAADTNLDPAITVHTVGKGHVVFFSTTANADWTTLPAKPAYAPLIHELVLGTIDSGDGWLNLQVGDSVEVPASLGLTAAPKMMDRNQKETPIVAMTDAAGATVYRSSPLVKPGLYQVSTGNAVYPVAVNIPSDEADVRTIAEPGIRKAMGDIGLSMHDDQITSESAAQLNSGRDYGWNIMLALLLLTGFECFMAMRLGHHRRVKTTAS